MASRGHGSCQLSLRRDELDGSEARTVDRVLNEMLLVLKYPEQRPPMRSRLAPAPQYRAKDLDS